MTKGTDGHHDTQQWKTERVPPNTANKTRKPAFTTAIQYCPEVLARALRQEKQIKGIYIEREEV